LLLPSFYGLVVKPGSIAIAFANLVVLFAVVGERIIRDDNDEITFKIAADYRQISTFAIMNQF